MTVVGYTGLPYTVINEPTEQAVQAGVTQWLADRYGPFPRTRLVFAFSGTATLRTPLLPANTGQLQGVRWEGLAKRSTVLAWAGTEPMLSAKGQLRNFEFKDFTVRSIVPNASGFYFLSNSTASNQDGRFERIEWQGSWDYGVGLNGSVNANLNSEIVFDQVALGNDASFSSAWFWSGMTPGHSQEDQFLNYSFRNTKLEGSHGDYIRLDYGGSVTIDGFNSWLHTGQSNNGVPAGIMLHLPQGQHNDSVCVLSANRIRAELRGPQSKLIDSGWGGSGHISFTALDDTANSNKPWGNYETHSYRSAARVSYRDCALGGWHGVHSSAPLHMVYDNCHTRNNPIASLVRHDVPVNISVR
jgi:hypothetical protein